MNNKTTLAVLVPTILGAMLTAFDSQIQAVVAAHPGVTSIVVAVLSTVLAHLPGTQAKTNG